MVDVGGVGAEDGGAEGVRGGVRDGDGVREGGGAREEADGGEEFFVRDAHLGRDVCEQSGGEVVAVGVVRVVEAGAADEETRALGDGGGDEGFQVREVGRGDAGAEVDGGAGVEVGAGAEGGDAGGEDGEECVVGVREGDDALDADAVLPGRLEDAAH